MRRDTNLTVLFLFALPFATCALELLNAQGKTGEAASYAGAASVTLAFLLYPSAAVVWLVSFFWPKKPDPQAPGADDKGGPAAP